MGLTLIRKSRNTKPKQNPVVALVLAGGAVSGGAFKVGGLKALDDFLVGRKIMELDTYVGLSAGALLSASLAAVLMTVSIQRPRDVATVGANVALWLEADIRRPTRRGPVPARKQTSVSSNLEAARSRSGYRSKADIGDDLAQCLLIPHFPNEPLI